MSGDAPARIRYAVYTRQSVAKPLEFSSCDGQLTTCREVADAVLWARGEWIGRRFDDYGYTGSTLNRPALTRLRLLIRAKTIDRVYVTNLDRLSRSVRDTSRLLQEFADAGVTLCIARGPDLCDGATARMVSNILGSFAEFEREMIASRIADARARMKTEGKRLAGPAPFGYGTDLRTKQLKPDAGDAGQVLAMFQMAADGMRPSEIARAVNAKGWTTRQFTAARSGRSHGGRPWTARQVLEVLHNPVYLGRFRKPGGTRHGCHKAIVDFVLFMKVQQNIRARRRTTGERHPLCAWPLRGILICPRCARPMSSYMVPHGNRRAKKIYRYYRCRSTAGGRPSCGGVQFSAGEVETAVCRILGRPETWKQLPGRRAHRLLEALCEVWNALNPIEQSRLLPKLVKRAVLEGPRGTMSIELSLAARDLLALAHAIPTENRRRLLKRAARRRAVGR